MDIKELNKKQLILLTLLITFVVSIATGIVTVSLMNQAPKNVPQTINNVIQRTIEKVTTVDAPVKEKENVDIKNNNQFIDESNIIVNIYSNEEVKTSVSIDSNISTGPDATTTSTSSSGELGQGVIISDIGLILVDTAILTESQVYKIILDKTEFVATVLKKFNNGFTVLKISEKKASVETPVKPEEVKITQ